MDHFEYRDGNLWCEDLKVETIARDVGTPVYVYSSATLLRHYDRFARAFAALSPTICYSIKSCQNLSILKLLNRHGAAFDVVSGGELFRALRAGADPSRIVFAGVGKSDREFNEAIDAGIGWFNVESEAEMENLIQVACGRKCEVRAALRVNPDVDPKTHRYTATGKKESKFGVDLERARRFFDHYGRDRHVRLCGIHLHIGSPVNSVEPYVAAITKGLGLIDDLCSAGFKIQMLDIGGGFGAHYKAEEAPAATVYAEAIVPLLKGRGLEIVIEPGRAIMANAGILVTEVQYIKESGEKEFVIVDAAMNDLLRPVLYDAYHFVWPVSVEERFVPQGRNNHAGLDGTKLVDVVGPVCESGDFLAHDRHLPPVQRGDLVAVFSAGAYGFVMSSQYNSRPRSAEVLVTGRSHKIIRRRETYEDLLRGEEL